MSFSRFSAVTRTPRPLASHGAFVNSIVVTPNGRLISAGDDHNVRIWDAESGAEIATLYGHDLSVMSLALSRDGERVVSASRDGPIRLWQTAINSQGITLVQESVNEENIGWTILRGCAADSPDGTLIVGSTFSDHLAQLLHVHPDIRW